VRHEVPPPELGEHTREVLVELLGMKEAEVAALRERGIV
jgi:crotonobetainyl-CoA:carnitine CoA-transferase CaiB-like acyl-CoA transferase